MEFQRLILIFALFIISFVLWNKWEAEKVVYTPQPITVQQKSAPNEVPVVKTSSSTPLPTLLTELGKVPEQNIIKVHTDVFNVAINIRGGDIVRSSLRKYPTTLDKPNEPFVLFNDDPNAFYVAVSRLLGINGPDTSATPATYSAPQQEYSLPQGQDTLEVKLHWENPQGLSVDKVFIFKRDNYLIDVRYDVYNHMKQNWEGSFASQIIRKDVPEVGGGGFFGIHPYVGAAISSPEHRYEEISLKKLQSNELDRTIQGGWVAMVQHYFLSAWVPPPQQTFHYYSKVIDLNQDQKNDIYIIGMTSDKIVIPINDHASIQSRLYVGPEITSVLKQIAPGLDLTVSYGWLWFISVIIFWLLKQINQIVGNWGWSIIIVTILIKLMFYHLSAKSYRSMAKLRMLQPKVEALRERYGEDKQKMGPALMELYKQEKVSPLGGCLPIIVQIPVFFALYMVLIESVELRQAPWILWIKDLSSPDPYYILPVLNGITMFIQQRLSPPPADPTQAKVMMLMPVLITVLFIGFPSGLLLYWVVNNILSILQQWYITYQFEHAKLKPKTT